MQSANADASIFVISSRSRNDNKLHFFRSTESIDRSSSVFYRNKNNGNDHPCEKTSVSIVLTEF